MIINESKALQYYTLSNPLSEYGWLAYNIRHLIENAGVAPSDIAVIAPKRAILREVSQILHTYTIPTFFDEGYNLLEKPHTKVLFTFLKYIHSMSEDQPENELLSDILCYPFWGIPRSVVWDVFTKRSRKEYLMAYLLDHPETKTIALFIQDLVIKGQSEPLESILDTIIGNQKVELEELKKDDNPRGEYTSPYKSYYFSDTTPEHEYLEALSSIRTIYEKIRSFRSPTLQEFIEYLKSLEQFKLPLNDAFSAILDGVQLLTVHGSKGLEFKYVFLPGCSEEIWFSKPRSSTLSWSRNLSKSPLNYQDDVLRLFYVASTRAKDALILSYSNFNEKGKAQQPFRALAQVKFTPVEYQESLKDTSDHPLVLWKNTWNATAFEDTERQALRQRVQQFKMTVTALNKFLAVDSPYGGGPEAFYKETLLRFPQRRSSSAGYGNAIHKAIAEYCISIKRGEKMDFDELIEFYTSALHDEHLDSQDEDKFIHQGTDHLKHYIQNTSFSPQSYIELSLEAHLDTIPIKGIIDRADKDGNFWTVIDLKTGKGFDTWNNTSKSLDYELQLQFYKLLIEHSPQYQGIVSEGIIDFVQDIISDHNNDRKHIRLPLDLRNQDQDYLIGLIKAVYTKIQNLDFPDTSHYPKNIKGRRQFEEDLLGGRI